MVEYKVWERTWVDNKDDESAERLEKQLNELGAEGWELKCRIPSDMLLLTWWIFQREK
jgi:hypothetical protein